MPTLAVNPSAIGIFSVSVTRGRSPLTFTRKPALEEMRIMRPALDNSGASGESGGQ